MPRNSSGTFSLPAGQPVVTGTTIDATVFNTLTADLASEITDSLDRSGKGAMLQPLQLTDGADVAPALTFATQPGSGIYNDSGDVVITIGGEVARFSQAGLSVTQVITSTALSYAANWASGTPTAGWYPTGLGEVSLEGIAVPASTAGNIIATLPVAARPKKACTFQCTITNLSFDLTSTTYAAAISVSTAGVISISRFVILSGAGSMTIHSAPITNGFYILDGIKFRVV